MINKTESGKVAEDVPPNAFKVQLEETTTNMVDILVEEAVRNMQLISTLQVSVMWETTDDLDLSCITPAGDVISPESHYRDPTACGGQMDIEANKSKDVSDKPIENIFWTRDIPNGVYEICVQNSEYIGSKKGQPIPFKLWFQGNVFKANGEKIDGFITDGACQGVGETSRAKFQITYSGNQLTESDVRFVSQARSKGVPRRGTKEL